MDFNTRYYLIESVQQILKTFNENCVITGLNIINLSINTDNLLTVDVSNGKVIADSTLIEYPSNFTINIDTTELDDSGSIILNVNFRYLRTSRLNQSTISLKYLTPDNQCDNWFPERDKLILAILNFDKTNYTTNYITSDILNNNTIMINDIEYDIRPYNYTIQELRPILQDLHNTVNT